MDTNDGELIGFSPDEAPGDLGINLRLSSFLSQLPALMFPFIDAFAISSVHPGQWNRHARWFVARKRNVQRSQRSSPGLGCTMYISRQQRNIMHQCTVASFVVSDSIVASLNLAGSLGKPGKKRPKQR